VLELDNVIGAGGDRPAGRTGRHPRVSGFGSEDGRRPRQTLTDPMVDEHLRAGERLWAIGDVTGILPLTMSGSIRGEGRSRRNILGEAASGQHEAVPGVT